MNDADVASPYWAPMLDLCAGLIRQQIEDQTRSMVLMAARIERHRQRIEELLQDAQAISTKLDAAIRITLSADAELALTQGPANQADRPDPIHEMTALGCSPTDGEIQHSGEHLDQYPIV